MASFPLREFPTLFHLWCPPRTAAGTHAVPACCMPVTEQRPQRPSTLARVWWMRRNNSRFLDIERLTKAQQRDIMAWGEQAGFARYVPAWEVKAYDRERGTWRTVRCTDPKKAQIVLTEPFLSHREVASLSWFVATPALETWHREKVLPDAAVGVLGLKYAADVLDCDGAFRRDEHGARRIALFVHRLERWQVGEMAAREEPTYRRFAGVSPGACVDTYC